MNHRDRGTTCFPETHAAAVRQTVIAIDNAIGMMKRYRQLTTVMAAKARANASNENPAPNEHASIGAALASFV
jgi:hypothetical protein